MNNYSIQNTQIIEYFLEKVKNINIITTNISQFKKLEERIMQEKGILLTVSNNKYKSLKKAKLIINVDMQKELKNYTINRNAIIINLENEKIKQLKAFEGIVINSVELKNSYTTEIKGNFEKLELLESLLYLELKQNYDENVKLIREKKITIKYLIGTNGQIDEEELKSSKFSLTKSKN